MKNLISGLLLLLLFNAATAQTCDDLPVQFRSFTQAMKAIQNTDFVLTEELPAGASTSIISASYYSCDNYFGYLVYSTQDLKQYIFERVPYKVWTEFKTAKTTIIYFVQNIQGKYRVVPD
jgi:hypothetical protein